MKAKIVRKKMVVENEEEMHEMMKALKVNNMNEK